MYFASTMLATVGYGDIYPITNIERIFSLFFMFIGVGFVTYFLNTISAYKLNYNRIMGTDFTDEIKNLKYWIIDIDAYDDDKNLVYFVKE